MKLTLNDSELKSALIAHAENMGIDLQGMTTTVTLVAGRKDGAGHSASIEILPKTNNNFGTPVEATPIITEEDDEPDDNISPFAQQG